VDGIEKKLPQWSFFINVFDVCIKKNVQKNMILPQLKGFEVGALSFGRRAVGSSPDL